MRKILILEDHDEYRYLVALTLDLPDFELIQTDNGEAALHLARLHQPELAILDVNIAGGVDGFEVCAQLKRDGRTPDIRVVMLTGCSEEEDFERGREAGADEFFTKPFSPLQLLGQIERQGERS